MRFGCVYKQSSTWLNFYIVFWVGADWQVEILLRAGSMVGSTARAYHKKVTLMGCTRFLSAEFSFGAELC